MHNIFKYTEIYGIYVINIYLKNKIYEKNILIIGSGSGIGKKLFNMYKKTYNVIATYRDSKPKKKNSKNLYKLDMSQQKKLENL